MNRKIAPSRIKDDITYTPINLGGFGLTHLNEIDQYESKTNPNE